jgi:hypothetical protein
MPQEGAWPHGRKTQIQSSFNLWGMALSWRPCLDECMYFKLCTCDSTMKWPKGSCSNLHKRSCAWRAMWNAITSSWLQKEIYNVRKPPLVQLIFASIRHSILGCWEHSTQCPHMHWEGWGLANLHLHHSMHVCEKVEMAWVGGYWEWKSHRITWLKEINVVINFHESKMIHGWYMPSYPPIWFSFPCLD